MADVLLLRSGNPRRLTEPVWRGVVDLCAEAGVPVLSSPPDPPGGPEDGMPGGLFTPVPEDSPPDEVTALLARHGADRIVHCADPDALVRRDAAAARGYWYGRGEQDRADRDFAAVDTLLHKGRTRDLCRRLGIGVPEGVWGPAPSATLRRRAAMLLERRGKVIVKDPQGWAGRGQTIAACPGELTRACDAAGDAPVVVEEFVAGEEISVEVLCLEDGAGLVLGWALKGGTDGGGHPLHRLRLVPAGAVPAGLASTAMRLCTAAGHQGMAEVEFVVRADGRPQVLECNPRVSAVSRTIAVSNGQGSTELAVRAALFGAGSLPEPARLETAERVLPRELSPGTLARITATPGVALVHPVTDGFQPRLMLGGVAGEARVDDGVKGLFALTGIDLAGGLEQLRACARWLAEACDGFAPSPDAEDDPPGGAGPPGRGDPEDDRRPAPGRGAAESIPPCE